MGIASGIAMSRIKDMDAVMAGLLACDPLALLPGEPNPDAASPSPSPRRLPARLPACECHRVPGGGWHWMRRTLRRSLI